MKFKIGFQGYEEEKEEMLQTAELEENMPVMSVVQVHFPDRGRSYAYYNDKFDLHKGDLVFVEGKPMLMRIFLICSPNYPRINT